MGFSYRKHGTVTTWAAFDILRQTHYTLSQALGGLYVFSSTVLPLATTPMAWLKPGSDAPRQVLSYIELTPFDSVKYEVDKTTGYIKS